MHRNLITTLFTATLALSLSGAGLNSKVRLGAAGARVACRTAAQVGASAVLALAFRPAPVPVHDDGDMPGHAFRVDPRLQLLDDIVGLFQNGVRSSPIGVDQRRLRIQLYCSSQSEKRDMT